MIDYVSSESWSQINKELSADFAGQEVRVYRGLAAAVYEVVSGLALFFPHKKSGIVLTERTNAFSVILPRLRQEGFQLSLLKQSTPENLAAITATDILFALHVEDQPITGETYPDAWELDQHCQNKKIFSVRVSHHLHYFKQHKEGNYGIRICSLSSDYAVVVSGPRFRASAQSVQLQNWTQKDLTNIRALLKSKKSEDQARVLDFEEKLTGDLSPFFNHQNRVFDRSVVSIRNVNTEAVVQQLAEYFAAPLQPAGEEQRFESPSPCRFHGIEHVEEFSALNGQLAQLLILDATTLAQLPPEVLASIVQKCRF